MALPGIIAHWPLAGNAQDAVADHHGQAVQLDYMMGPTGRPRSAAAFDGRGSLVRVEDHPRLRLGTGDFTCSAWIRCEAPMTHAFGDVLSKFDPVSRCGLNLSVSGSSPAYSAMSDQRHVHFGIDDGCLGSWQDLGKPEAGNSSVTTMVTFEGQLYAGIADAATPDRACRVFRYDGGQAWHDCGRLGDDPTVLSVMSMLVHDGRLYAGNGNWDWDKARGDMPGFTAGKVHVYEYRGGSDWHDLGQVGEGHRVMCLASFAGDLFAGLDAGDGGGRVLRHSASGWIDCGAPDGRNIEGLLASGGTLHACTHGNIYRYDGGTGWTCIGAEPFGITQIHCMTEVAGRLWIGTWPQGYVLRQDESLDWVIAGRLGLPRGLFECNEVMDLRVHNGKLYAGLIPKSQVWRYEADGHWTLLNSLASRPDFQDSAPHSWCRVTCLNSFAGGLCAATGSCYSRAEHQDEHGTLGRVHGLTIGQVCSHEHDIGGDWTHVAAVRDGRHTRLYIDGTLSASAEAPARTTLDLTNTEPLLIGVGGQTWFCGAMADVQLYGRALTQEELRRLVVGSE